MKLRRINCGVICVFYLLCVIISYRTSMHQYILCIPKLFMNNTIVNMYQKVEYRKKGGYDFKAGILPHLFEEILPYNTHLFHAVLK